MRPAMRSGRRAKPSRTSARPWNARATTSARSDGPRRARRLTLASIGRTSDGMCAASRHPAPSRLMIGRPELALIGITRSEEHTSELQSLMRISYAVFCLKKKKKNGNKTHNTTHRYEHTKYNTHHMIYMTPH